MSSDEYANYVARFAWMPIESAPRGRRVIVFNKVTGPYTSENIGGEWPLLIWGGRTGRWYPQPTHWMPLPDDPQ